MIKRLNNIKQEPRDIKMIYKDFMKYKLMIKSRLVS